MNYRSAADRPIDDAHSRIADAEMLLNHSYATEAVARAGDALARAQRYLARAVAAKAAWDAVEHDDYEVYPAVLYEAQGELPLGWRTVDTSV